MHLQTVVNLIFFFILDRDKLRGLYCVKKVAKVALPRMEKLFKVFFKNIFNFLCYTILQSEKKISN